MDFELQKRYSKKVNCKSKNSIELTTPELRCLTNFSQLPLRVELWSLTKHALTIYILLFLSKQVELIMNEKRRHRIILGNLQ
jgi:hypothetical protein